jgi:hypothetical protein
MIASISAVWRTSRTYSCDDKMMSLPPLLLTVFTPGNEKPDRKRGNVIDLGKVDDDGPLIGHLGIPRRFEIN